MTVYTPGENDDRLWKDTDYTVADFRKLVFSGQIPSKFITVFPSGNTEVSGAVTLSMKHYPKKDFAEEGVDPLEGILKVLHRLAEDEALGLDDGWKANAGIVPVAGDPERVEIIYYNAEELAVLIEASPDDTRTLLQLVHTQNPELDPWIIDDPKEGYMVAYPLIRQFQQRNEDFGEFLNGIVTGRIRILTE